MKSIPWSGTDPLPDLPATMLILNPEGGGGPVIAHVSGKLLIEDELPVGTYIITDLRIPEGVLGDEVDLPIGAMNGIRLDVEGTDCQYIGEITVTYLVLPPGDGGAQFSALQDLYKELGGIAMVQTYLTADGEVVGSIVSFPKASDATVATIPEAVPVAASGCREGPAVVLWK